MFEKMAARKRTQDVLNDDESSFTSLLLSQNILDGLEKVGFKKPSPVQLRSIPFGKCGLDMIVQAKSGTGKTCVFAVVALEMVSTMSIESQIIVLAPTREIAAQIHEFFCIVGSFTHNLHCNIFIGGTAVEEDKKKLSRCQIIIGTPGRVKSLIESGILITNTVRLFVLDEADKLLEPGSFQDQINWIYSTLPKNKQVLALSATYPEYLAKHLMNYMNEPVHIRLNTDKPALLGIKQIYMTVSSHHLPHVVFERKAKKLAEFLKRLPFQQCMVFSNYQSRAQMLADMLSAESWPAACIAGNQSQTERFGAMKKLKDFKCRVLISTDLTSRGIDCDKVDLVVNLDMPWDADTYLHRVGRAGRFGNYGLAVSFVTKGKEEDKLLNISREIHYQIAHISDLEKVEEIANVLSKCGSETLPASTSIPAVQEDALFQSDFSDIVHDLSDHQAVSVDRDGGLNVNGNDASDNRQGDKEGLCPVQHDFLEAVECYSGDKNNFLIDCKESLDYIKDEDQGFNKFKSFSGDEELSAVAQDSKDQTHDFPGPKYDLSGSAKTEVLLPQNVLENSDLSEHKMKLFVEENIGQQILKGRGNEGSNCKFIMSGSRTFQRLSKDFAKPSIHSVFDVKDSVTSAEFGADSDDADHGLAIETTENTEEDVEGKRWQDRFYLEGNYEVVENTVTDDKHNLTRTSCLSDCLVNDSKNQRMDQTNIGGISADSKVSYLEYNQLPPGLNKEKEDVFTVTRDRYDSRIDESRNERSGSETSEVYNGVVTCGKEPLEIDSINIEDMFNDLVCEKLIDSGTQMLLTYYSSIGVLSSHYEKSKDYETAESKSPGFAIGSEMKVDRSEPQESLTESDKSLPDSDFRLHGSESNFHESDSGLLRSELVEDGLSESAERLLQFEGRLSESEGDLHNTEAEMPKSNESKSSLHDFDDGLAVNGIYNQPGCNSVIDRKHSAQRMKSNGMDPQDSIHRGIPNMKQRSNRRNTVEQERVDRPWQDQDDECCSCCSSQWNARCPSNFVANVKMMENERYARFYKAWYKAYRNQVAWMNFHSRQYRQSIAYVNNESFFTGHEGSSK